MNDLRPLHIIRMNRAAPLALPDNLLKSGGYAGESIALGLDDLDGISVWCVAVEIDLGSGVFAAP